MILAVVLLSVLSTASCSPQSSYECGACQLLITEMEVLIRKVDATKTIKIGSFRVGPDGGQRGLQEIPFARSDAHLNEIYDGICEQSKNYKLVVNSLTGKGRFVNKDATYLKDQTKPGVLSKLHDACNDFADGHEEEIIKFLKTESADAVKEFCHTELAVCSAVDVSPLPPNEGDEKAVEEINDEL